MTITALLGPPEKVTAGGGQIRPASAIGPMGLRAEKLSKRS